MAAAAVAFVAADLRAAPVDFLFTGTGSGYLGGVGFTGRSFAVMISTLTAKDHRKRRRSQLKTTDKPVTTEKVKRQPEDRIVSDAKDNSDETQD